MFNECEKNECLISAVYLIQNSADLHKLFVQFSHQKQFVALGLSMNSNVYVHSYHKYFTIFTSVLYRTFKPLYIPDTTRPQIKLTVSLHPEVLHIWLRQFLS